MIKSDDDYVMYILLNNDIPMDEQNKIIQCCHSVCKIIRCIEQLDKKPVSYKKWNDSYQKKIILKATEQDMIFCIDQYSDISTNFWCTFILDSGSDNMEPLNLTSLAFIPIDSKNTPTFIKKLKYY